MLISVPIQYSAEGKGKKHYTVNNRHCTETEANSTNFSWTKQWRLYTQCTPAKPTRLNCRVECVGVDGVNWVLFTSRDSDYLWRKIQQTQRDPSI